MSHLGGGVRKGPFAEVTVVGFFPTVHQLMPLQVSRSGEELPTVLTAVSRLICVSLPVQV